MTASGTKTAGGQGFKSVAGKPCAGERPFRPMRGPSLAPAFIFTMDAVILAGGKGSRMDDALPKALVVAHGKPIVAHQLDYLLPQVDHVVLSLGHRAQDVIDYVKKAYAGKPISCVVEETPLGTGGALKLALSKSSAEKILALNCDDLTDIDVSHLAKSAEALICVANPRLPFGLVKDREGYAHFEEKPLMTQHWVSCGWYMFLRKEIEKILPDSGSLEYDVFPKLKLRVHKHTGFWQPLNSKKDIATFEEKPLPSSLQ